METAAPGWNLSFHVQGQVCPLIGSLRPLPSEAPKLLQVYFIDSQVEETSTRMHITSGMKQNIIHELSAIMKISIFNISKQHKNFSSAMPPVKAGKLLSMKRNGREQNMFAVLTNK